MMLKRPFLQEINLLRVQSEDIDLSETPDRGSERGREKRYVRTTGTQWRNRRSEIQSWKKRSSSRSSSRRSSRRKQGPDDASKSATLDSLGTALDKRRRKSEGEGLEQTIVYEGMLHKTSRTKITTNLRRTQNEHRQYRRFQLTEHSLEYSQLLQRVRVRKQYPLTSIVEIVYEKNQNPVAFKLVFQRTEILLEAPSENECILWVDAIRREWRKWNIRPSQKFNDQTAELPESNAAVSGDPGARGSYLNDDEGYFRRGEEVLAISSPASSIVPKESTVGFPELLPSGIHDEPSHGARKYLRRETDIPADDVRQNPSQGRIAGRIGLAPRLQRSHWDTFQQKLGRRDEDDFDPLHKLDFVMIKYPRRGRSIPHERVFTMDFENMMMMWRRTAYSKFKFSHMLLTEHIVEVREGQDSEGFDRYPYEEVDDQSFSVLVEGVKRAGPTSSTYTVLQSLDLICDSFEERQLWCRAVCGYKCTFVTCLNCIV